MKKAILFLTLIFAVSFIASSQSTTPKADTVIVPAYEKLDTIKVNVILYPDGNGTVKYSYGYVVVKGFAILQKNGKTWQWTQQPLISGALDEKKLPIKKYLQIIQ